MRKRTKVLASAALAVALAAGGGATAYASYYQDRALPGSTVAGLSVAGMTQPEIAAAVRAKAASVVVSLDTPDGRRAVPLADLGATIDVDATVDRVFDANRRWTGYAKALIEHRAVDPVATTNQSTYAALTAGLQARSGHPATDATVTLGRDRATFTVTPAVTGEALDTSRLPEVVAQAVRSLTSASATLTLVERVPAVTTTQAQAIADQANALVRAGAAVTDGNRKVTASAGRKASWVTIPLTDGRPGAPVVDAAKVSTWVASRAKEFAVAPQQGLRYVTSAGAVLRVLTPATNGRKVTNTPAVAAKLIAGLQSGTATTGRFTTAVVPAAWTERRVAKGAENLAYPAADGEKWIDVNLSRHTMTAYVGATVALGPVLMVNGAPATPTDVGLFHIYLKNPLMTMRGHNADGTTYETPDVPWSSFFNGGEALHGAYWRETFGYAASHGCVNLPIPTAKWIYDWAPIGTPVASHG
ncbi:MAG: L,D-transpeptidase family protein [Tetrasphaera sp.]|jgi:lipoprotein-anchoring transpeptidase ErfK/SrfK|nr:L,D-transpeptidase family protein [Tetrasphaera sp.]